MCTGMFKDQAEVVVAQEEVQEKIDLVENEEELIEEEEQLIKKQAFKGSFTEAAPYTKTIDVEVIGNISEANLSKNIDEYDLLVSGDLSTPGNPYTQQKNKDFALFQVGVDVIAPLMAEDAEAHTSMEMEGEDTELPSGTKRKKEVELLQREENGDFDGFVKSLCEGLRPRGGKDLLKGGISISTKTYPEKSTKKSKPSDVTKKHAKETSPTSAT
ncbi:hypothetical protein Tco_1104142 [Tanacetum coccineum]